MTDFTPEEIEAGRKLFAGEWRFVAASGTLERLPPMEGVEIAFAGRSNVGKSSLVNALSGRKALARASHTPGRTQELIFFAGPPGLKIADMPGYGYAAVSKEKVKAWTKLIHAYLKGRANLARVYLLVDARHGLKDTDEPVLDGLDDEEPLCVERVVHAHERGGHAPERRQILSRRGTNVHQLPWLGIDAHGSAFALASPFCKSSTEWPSGDLTNAIRPSRGGLRMAIPPACRAAHLA